MTPVLRRAHVSFAAMWAGEAAFMVALAVVVGITIIVAAGFGKVVSFEHIYPTIVPKS